MKTLEECVNLATREENILYELNAMDLTALNPLERFMYSLV